MRNRREETQERDWKEDIIINRAGTVTSVTVTDVTRREDTQDRNKRENGEEG